LPARRSFKWAKEDAIALALFAANRAVAGPANALMNADSGVTPTSWVTGVWRQRGFTTSTSIAIGATEPRRISRTYVPPASRLAASDAGRVPFLVVSEDDANDVVQQTIEIAIEPASSSTT
jgi:hypothetical protein